MITSASYYLNIYQEGQLFYEDLEVAATELPKSLVMLSALGARICYSPKPPHKILEEDKRLTDDKEMLAFLERCYKAGHFSVFAHTPIFIKSDKYPYDSKLPYKAFSYSIGEETYICANLRHLMEYKRRLAHDFELNLREDGGFLLEGPYFYNPELGTWSGELTNSKKYIMGFCWPANPWFWFSFVIHGYSRAMTHQLVRHTWLNFSQRSHRYTEVEDVVCPPSIKDKVIKNGIVIITAAQLFDDVVKNTKTAYDLLVEFGIPKEDARYLFPTGATTTIMASGPYFVWDDFVSKRTVKGAQWEIKEIASAIKQFMEDVVV